MKTEDDEILWSIDGDPIIGAAYTVCVQKMEDLWHLIFQHTYDKLCQFIFSHPVNIPTIQKLMFHNLGVKPQWKFEQLFRI